MNTKSDFYVGTGLEAEWLGSLLHNGDVWHIPLEILIQINKTSFEELTLEFLRSNNGIIPEDRDYWPHQWEDSLLSDYAYMFDLNHEQVYMYQQDNEFLLNPVKILQGYGLDESNTFLPVPEFPKMNPIISERKRLYDYGSTYPNLI